MRPLTHPAIENVTVEGILYALSDPVRVAIYARLSASDCAATCSAFADVLDRSIPKSTLSQHFRTLREAGLIHSKRHGVEMRNTSRCTEIGRRFPGLIPAILDALAAQSGRRAHASKRKPRQGKD